MHQWAALTEVPVKQAAMMGALLDVVTMLVVQTVSIHVPADVMDLVSGDVRGAA